MKSRFEFTLPEFPNDNFEMERNGFSGKSILIQNGVLVEQSSKKGKPFLVKTKEGTIIEALPVTNFPDLSAPALRINGVKHILAPNLKWYEYIFGGLPFFLLFAGGAIGGMFGFVAIVLNYNCFREQGSTSSKYLKVLLINIICYAVVLTLAGLIYKLIH